jgi:hypothetical protein
MDDANTTSLCRSCGLCCTGHLFIWVKLRPAELDPAEALGLKVLRSHPNQRGFNQPCPMWQGDCAIHDSAHYPHACRAYNCKLLKEVNAGRESLPHALTIVQNAKERIREVESLLPASSKAGFRERLAEELESGHGDIELQAKAKVLLDFYEECFGVDDVVDR